MVLVGVLSLMAINMEAQQCLATAEPIGWTNSSAGHAVSTGILGRRTASSPPLRIPARAPRGFTP